MLTQNVTKVTLRAMKKKNVIKLFGGTSRVAKAIGIKSQAVSKWPDILTAALSDRVIAACVRAGLDPAPLLEAEQGGTTAEDTMKERRSAA